MAERVGEDPVKVSSVVQRQLERDNLEELIAVAEAAHGAITEQEIEALRQSSRVARQGSSATRA